MKIVLAMVMFLAAIMPAQSLVYISRPAPSPVSAIAVFPVAFMVIEANLCNFVAWSVAPDWPPARQKLALGDCPPRASYK